MSAELSQSPACFAALLSEARRATHPLDGALLDRTDLADIVERLRQAVEQLVAERDALLAERSQLSGRLMRSSPSHPNHVDANDSGVFTLPPRLLRTKLKNTDGGSVSSHAAGGDSGLGPMS